MLALVLTVLWIGVAGSALLSGLDYYLLPLPERAYSELAPLFAPTGTVGHGLGVLGTLMISTGVAGYSLRKRWGALQRAGSLRHWLQVHIFLCTLGPFLVLLHTSFKFGGLVSIAFWSMAVVVASGLFGRYVYAHIPRSLQGRFLELETIRGRLEELTEAARAAGAQAGADLRDLLSAPPAAASRTPAAALAFAFRDDLRRRSTLRRMGRAMRARSVPRPLREELLSLAREHGRLSQATALLLPLRRLFRYWHVVHLPLAVVMFLVLGVHVTVAVLFGYAWIL